ncbi:MAG: hypothetical protein ACRD82_00530, partial [Blastocatellia bacterium]
PYYSRLDLHADYPFKLGEYLKLTLVGDFFNVTNNQKLRLSSQFRESTAGQLNPDFGKPVIYHPPFNMRLGLKLEF